MHEALKTATERVANLLNDGTSTYRLPPELLTRILDLAVDHGSEEYAKQVVLLTHVCRYWRTALMSYPRMWSTVYMKPGDPSVISEWLARSQKTPLTIIAEFKDSYYRPPCRYQNEATATLDGNDRVEVCPRHQAVLSLDQLFPHRSRIRDLAIFLRSSSPSWDEEDHDDHPALMSHHFFMMGLPNLEHLDFRAVHVEQGIYSVPLPDYLFAGNLPRLKVLKYLGVTRGLTGVVKNLTSCELGRWSVSTGPGVLYPDQLGVFLNNNKTLKSLTINQFEFLSSEPEVPPAIPMTDLKFLRVDCFFGTIFEKFLDFIYAPQFKDLDTVQLSIPSMIQAVATDNSGHTFQFIWNSGDIVMFQPLLHLGAVITTLRLDQGMTHQQLGREPAIRTYFRLLDTVQVLEFGGTIADYVQDALSITGVFPGLKVIRVAVDLDDCKRSLQLLATASKQRMDEGNPLARVEPLLAEGEDELEQSLRVEWEECYKAENIHDFLSN